MPHTTKTGDKICTIGYPNIQMQGQEAKYTEGVVTARLSDAAAIEETGDVKKESIQ